MVSGHARERTTLIVTVLNEAGTIDTLLQSIAAQTCLPDEVVILDGGSSDGTRARLDGWTDVLPLRILEAPGANIARGRNLAIQACTAADLIAVTDAGVRLDTGWLEALVNGLTSGVDVVGGFFIGDPQTTFERAMVATVLPAVEDIRAESFLPSSRSVLFRRTAWVAVGGYPEWLDYCEDLVFDLALKRAGFGFGFAPEAVAHFRPRGSLRAFFRQYYLYARGDGKADLWRKRHAIRYATYFSIPVLLRFGRVGFVALAAGGLAYVLRPLRRLWPLVAGSSPKEVAYAGMLVPVIRLVGDVAKMLGYPLGVWWRLRR